MTPHQIELIQNSFAKVAPIADRSAGLFYGRLFEIAPELRPLFKGDISAQGRKFMATLTVAVTSLQTVEALKPGLRALARQHVAFGVRADHYAPLGEALIWTLQQGLGDAFTPETEQAWQMAYADIAETMKSAGV